MADKSNIEWCDGTWNPVSGCTKVSEGCRNCYAERMAKRLKAMGQPRYAAGFDVRCHADALAEPLRWRKPRVIFVCSMSDLFQEDVPDDFIANVLGVIMWAEKMRGHKFLILTKRPRRMAEFFRTHTPSDVCKIVLDGDNAERAGVAGPMDQVRSWMKLGFHFESQGHDARLSPARDWPLPNVGIGVTCEDQARADERIPELLACPAAMRFVSVEPMLGAVKLGKYIGGPEPWDDVDVCQCCGEEWRHDLTHECPPAFTKVNWVICGGESGPGARPMHPDWVRGLRDDCQAAGTPFFFKQWGEWKQRMKDEGGRIKRGAWGTLDRTGEYFAETTPWNGRQGADSESGEVVVERVGKKRAGRLVDGKEHKAAPSGWGSD